MKLTPSTVIDAPSYYVDHFDGKYNVDNCTILRNLNIETDSESFPSSMKHLKTPTNVLDLTNNDLFEIPNLRNRTDIHTLLLSRNRIRNIDGQRLPINLVNLVLASNEIKNLADINGLRKCPKTLKNVTFRGNPICHLEGYREYILRLVPRLDVLDFSRISDIERNSAKNTEIKTKVKVPGTETGTEIRTSGDKAIEMMNFVVGKMSKERRKELKEQLAKATTLEEISRLEKLLSGGV
ncbi:hypothetical protein KAFR_0K00240 [Kazachstania africana CBS 2517]|uniref:U2 small nuclear ribonucleoprotein A' n=1 Tax=Kazachstania africana (strain ATCC 22294 / BCRC 22015 / CBS 2517 / CECT 1963 / NBRC 1671 / NRRL Y-8276) TaxID=1071382 RepID=H2B179_KAZAF|nr:hypothetical protein KAFR_0K00240 [Kazachstania africana CBS 2517]CCF60379.1 hypothetical protein KAFR_0K00240 [Kazachstania africana CBS 2517]